MFSSKIDIFSLSTSIFAQPWISLTLTCFSLVICLTRVSPNSIRVSLSAVTLWPQGILDAKHEFAGLSWTDNPTDLAISRISDLKNFVSTSGLRIPFSFKAWIPGR